MTERGGFLMAEERHMKMTPKEKRKLREVINHDITPRTGGFYPKPGPGRANERFEKAANRRAADIYVQNF